MVVVCVSLYLAAIVIANTMVAMCGQVVLPFTATVLIPFDLVTRDVLHHKWQQDRLWPKMIGLVLVGSLLSAAMSPAVAFASAVAFGSAGLVNAGIYAITPSLSRWYRMNVSNVFAAAVDSAVFPMLAFDVVDIRLCVIQAACKIVGGCVFTSLFLWSANSDNNC